MDEEDGLGGINDDDVVMWCSSSSREPGRLGVLVIGDWDIVNSLDS